MKLSTRRIAIVCVVIATLTVLAATGYAVRARLARAPFIRALFERATVIVADTWGQGATGAQADHTSRPFEEAGAATGGSPRAEVNIDPRRQQLIGVRTAPVERTSLTTTIRTVGVVAYDETKLADVNVKIEGWIQDLYVDYTDKLVHEGDPLFTLYSPELVTTQSEYLLALRTRDQVSQSQIADARKYAERLVDAARRRLVLWDLPREQLEALDESREPQIALVFRSPADGFVIEKAARQGMHVMPGQSLYTIADLSVVWVEADLYERDLPLVSVGAPAVVTVDAYPAERFQGRVIYIYPFVEEQTRTVKVRLAFGNPRGQLKPGMYTNVDLNARIGMGLAVPANALLDSGVQQYIFVSQGDGYFEPRPVKVGQRLGETIQILEGLREGEVVATGATFFIDSESQLQAALQGFEPARTMAAGTPGSRERLDIAFRSDPDPPKSGGNQFEVSVRDAAGEPIPDGEVTVVFFMAAMPTMNMPAMKTEAALAHVEKGVYRGTGEVMMAGRWNVSVLVTRAGERIGSSQLTVVAQ